MIYAFGMLLIIGGGAALPFLLSDDARTRGRIYLPLSAAPVLSVLLFVLLGFNGYAIGLLAFVFTFPMSLALTVTGVLLVALARPVDGARGRLTAATLLAAGPILFAVVLFTSKLLVGN
jgi:hypothetical protein